MEFSVLSYFHGFKFMSVFNNVNKNIVSLHNLGFEKKFSVFLLLHHIDKYNLDLESIGSSLGID